MPDEHLEALGALGRRLARADVVAHREAALHLDVRPPRQRPRRPFIEGELGAALDRLIREYCDAEGLDWPSQGQPFLKKLQTEAMQNSDVTEVKTATLEMMTTVESIVKNGTRVRDEVRANEISDHDALNIECERWTMKDAMRASLMSSVRLSRCDASRDHHHVEPDTNRIH